MQRRQRFHRRYDFERLRREGRVARHPIMTLSWLPNDLAHNRYGFITPKRLGSAVTRNRVRRLLREAVRQIQPRLKAGFDMVIVARPDIAHQPFAVIVSTLHSLCQRAGIVEEA